MRKRKPWLAALLSLVCPGLGQLYNGDLRLPIFALLLGSALSFYSVVYLFDSFDKLLKALFLGLLLDSIFAFHAWFQARRVNQSAENRTRLFQRWWIYLGYILVAYGLPDGYGFFFPTRMMSFQIPSESMLPTLLVGDRLVADGWAYWKKDLKRGDVIVFDFPSDPKIKYVKRLIGLPGDDVELREGELYLNGKIVPQRRSNRPIVMESGWESVEFIENLDGVEHPIYRVQPMSVSNFGPVTVPENSYFAMGDNRDRSNDSRFWGFVPRKNILARMSYIYFSWNNLEKMIRRDRFGLQIR